MYTYNKYNSGTESYGTDPPYKLLFNMLRGLKLLTVTHFAHFRQATVLHGVQCCLGYTTVLHCPPCSLGHENSGKLSCEATLPGPQCCQGHNAALPTVLACPQCCPGHSAALPTLLPGPQRCTAHRAAWATVLACTQCCQGCSAPKPTVLHGHVSARPTWT